MKKKQNRKFTLSFHHSIMSTPSSTRKVVEITKPCKPAPTGISPVLCGLYILPKGQKLPPHITAYSTLSAEELKVKTLDELKVFIRDNIPNPLVGSRSFTGGTYGIYVPKDCGLSGDAATTLFSLSSAMPSIQSFAGNCIGIFLG